MSPCDGATSPFFCELCTASGLSLKVWKLSMVWLKSASSTPKQFANFRPKLEQQELFESLTSFPKLTKLQHPWGLTLSWEGQYKGWYYFLYTELNAPDKRAYWILKEFLVRTSDFCFLFFQPWLQSPHKESCPATYYFDVLQLGKEPNESSISLRQESLNGLNEWQLF